MLWTHTNIVVPSFIGSTEVDLPAPCTFDFNVASAKYFHALENGVVPLLLLFSGTVFYADGDAPLQVDQIPWSKEAAFELPVGVWKQMMDEYYPNTAWLCLSREVFDRLHQYKMDRGLPTWEQTRGEHAAVNMDMVEKVANAVLYEGYMLYPYTASSVKNRQRWNFGVLSPPAYDASEMQTECLIVGDASVNARVRFLQDTRRCNDRTRHRTVGHHPGFSARCPL